MPKGRPRQFDIDQALNCALEVFWRKGYEGTSLPDLTKAMGINRPSLYAAFGNKESLFRKVLDRYLEGPAAYIQEALALPTARAVAERLVYGSIDLLTDPKQPKGCLIVQGAIACGKEGESIRKELITRRSAGELAIRKRFQKALVEGDLPAHFDPADLAKYLMTIIHGLSIQSASGATRKELYRVGEIALRAWPN